MQNLHIEFSKAVGKIKPMHATGQPPFTGGFHKLDFSYVGYLQKAHVPYSRLHDVGGPYGGNRFVDIPNIFRDFNADVNDPASYDFTFTDVLITNMYAYNVEPIFRLGVTIENQAIIKPYRILSVIIMKGGQMATTMALPIGRSGTSRTMISVSTTKCGAVLRNSIMNSMTLRPST